MPSRGAVPGALVAGHHVQGIRPLFTDASARGGAVAGTDDTGHEEESLIRILEGDCRDMLRTLDAGSVQTCVTSPPYFGLRDYGVAGQIGLEPTPDEFIAAMVAVFREVRRVLADDGTLWLNLGDSYAANRGYQVPDSKHRDVGNGIGMKAAELGAKPKDLLMIPARVALALQADGWWLRSHIIWHKPNPMPESVTDRPTSAHESIFLLTKAARYFYDAEAVREEWTSGRDDMRAKGVRTGKAYLQQGAVADNSIAADADGLRRSGNVPDGRNLRNVWTVATQPFSGAHFATFPPALIEPCIKAGSRPGDMVLDPFGGAGTTGLVADRLGRNAVLVELNPAYAAMARERIRQDAGMFAMIDEHNCTPMKHNLGTKRADTVNADDAPVLKDQHVTYAAKFILD